MSLHRTATAVLALAASVLVDCGSREQTSPAPPEPTAPVAAPAEVASPAAPSPAAPAPSVAPAPASPAAAPAPARPKSAPASPKPPSAAPSAAPAAAASTPVPRPVVAAVPAVPATKPGAAVAAPASPAPKASGVVDPGGDVAVPAKTGTTRIGDGKCRMCHKVQHDSWAASAHAKRTPPLDCEGCHGPGSDYKTLTVMKDPAKAKAAGLVLPDAAFCARCHKGAVDAAYLAKVHAHKARP